MSHQDPIEPVDLVMPQDFPTVPYEAIYKRSIGKWEKSHFWPTQNALNQAVEAVGKAHSSQASALNPADIIKADTEEAKARQEWNKEQFWVQQFIGAWKGIAHRFLSCVEHDTGFIESIRKESNRPGPMGLYIQERELLGFFVTGLAALESLGYGLYALGRLARPGAFELIDQHHTREQRDINLSSTREQFQKQFPHEGITHALNQLLLLDPAYQEWLKQRNILAHRISPGRRIALYAGVPDRGEVWSLAQNMPINIDTTASRRQWLAATLETLLTSTDTFTGNHF